MPIFEYMCDQCGYSFDKMVLRAGDHVQCPLCQGEVKKLMSTFSVGASHKMSGNLPPEIRPKMCTNC
jgi:putative FmdB family regulatory protein